MPERVLTAFTYVYAYRHFAGQALLTMSHTEYLLPTDVMIVIY